MRASRWPPDERMSPSRVERHRSGARRDPGLEASSGVDSQGDDGDGDERQPGGAKRLPRPVRQLVGVEQKLGSARLRPGLGNGAPNHVEKFGAAEENPPRQDSGAAEDSHARTALPRRPERT